MSSIEFDDPDIVAKIEATALADLDALPFGVVRIDDNNVVQVFNFTEAELSGFGSRAKIGKNFFVDIAPCMSGPGMRGRIEAARKLGALDIEIGWIGDFNDKNGEMRIRALSASGGGVWLFLDREDV